MGIGLLRTLRGGFNKGFDFERGNSVNHPHNWNNFSSFLGREVSKPNVHGGDKGSTLHVGTKVFFFWGLKKNLRDFILCQL